MRLGVGDSFGEMSLITVRGLALKTVKCQRRR
jgi:hypothetical protein